MTEKNNDEHLSNDLTLEELEELDKLEEEYNEESLTQPSELAKNGRCLWCNEVERDDFRLYQFEFALGNVVHDFLSCSLQHENKMRSFYKYNNRLKIIYYLFILLFPFIFLFLTLFLDFSFIIFIFVSFGLGVVLFPMLGEVTVQNLGLKRSIILGRVLGLIVIFIACVFYLFLGPFGF